MTPAHSSQGTLLGLSSFFTILRGISFANATSAAAATVVLPVLISSIGNVALCAISCGVAFLAATREIKPFTAFAITVAAASIALVTTVVALAVLGAAPAVFVATTLLTLTYGMGNSALAYRIYQIDQYSFGYAPRGFPIAMMRPGE